MSSGREHEHDDERDHEEQHVADHHRDHEQQALHELQVAGAAADDLSGAQLVLRAAVEPDQRLVHLGAQVVLHVEGEPAAVEAPDEGQAVDEQRRPRPAGVIHSASPPCTADHDVVDDDLGEQRDEGHDAHAAQRGAEGEQHVPPVAPAVPRQAPGPAGPPLVRLAVFHSAVLPPVSSLQDTSNATALTFHPGRGRWIRPRGRRRRGSRPADGPGGSRRAHSGAAPAARRLSVAVGGTEHPPQGRPAVRQ